MNWSFFNGFHRKNTINTTDSTEEDMNMFMSDERKGNSEKMRTNLRSSVREKRVEMKSNFWKNAAMWLVAAGTLLGGAGEARASGFWTTGAAEVKFVKNGPSTTTVSINSSGIADTALGTVTALKIDSFWVKTWKSNPGNICGAKLHYKLYLEGSSDIIEDEWSPNISWSTDGNNQQLSTSDDLNIFTLCAEPGNWVFEYWFTATGSDDNNDNCGTTYYLSNNGGNYKAKFFISPATISGPWTVNWWNDTSATTGNWKNDTSPWWYSVSGDGFAWMNCVDGGPNHVVINNDKLPSQNLTENTTVKSLTYNTGVTSAHSLGGNYTLTVKEGITNSAVTNTISAKVELGGASTFVSTLNNTCLKITGALDLKTYTLTVSSGTATTRHVQVTEKISGSGKILKKNKGMMTLSGNNDFTGGVEIENDGGKLNINSDSALGTGDFAIGLRAFLDNTSAGAVTVTGPSTVKMKTFTFTGTQPLAFTNVTLQSATIITNNGTLTIGDLSGGYDLELKSSGTTILSGTDKRTSKATKVTAGTLQIGNGGTTGTTSRNITNNSAVVFNHSGATTYSAVISGSGTVEKQGAGTLTLSGTSTVSGNTTVNEGTLYLSGSLASSAVTVSGGTLEPSESGKSIKSLAMSSGAVVASPSKSFTVSGTVNLTGGTVKFTPPSTLPSVETRYAVATGGTSSSHTGATLKDGSGSDLGGPGTWELEDYSNGLYVKYTPVTQTVTVTPNPATVTVGDTVQLSVEVAGGSPELTYTSSDTSKATVSASGLVSGVAAGNVTITVSAAAVAGYTTGSGTCSVTVMAGAEAPTAGTPSAGNINSNAATITLGSINAGGAATTVSFKYKLSTASSWTVVEPDTTSIGAGVTAGSSSVSLTGLTAGKTYDYQWTLENSVTDSSGTPTVQTGSVTTADEITLGTRTYKYAGNPITIVAAGGGGGSGAFSYACEEDTGTMSSFNPSTRVLTPTKYGTFNLTVTKAAQGDYAEQSATFSVTVQRGTQAAVSLSTTTFTWAGSDINLKTYATGGTGSGAYSVTYSADGTGSGSVSSSKLTATAAGTMTVVVTRAADNLWAKKTATIEITVNKGTQTVTLNKSTATIAEPGNTASLTATQSPASGGGTITWSSSDTSKATVDGGTVTGVAEAESVTISAQAAGNDLWNASAAASCTVTVRAAEPTKNPAIAVASRTTDSITLTVTKASDAAFTLIEVNTGGTGATYFANPSDGQSYTAADGAYTTGERIESKAYVVLAGDGTSVTVTGLSAGKQYNFRAYAYNGSGTTANYRTTSSATLNPYTLPNTPTLTAAADGYEMVRLTATKPSGTFTGLVLIDGGSATPSTAPGDVGTGLGGGTIIWKGTDTANIEHVVAANGAAHNYRLFAYAGTTYSAAATGAATAGTWSGVSAADAFAVTNGAATHLTAGTQGTGWDGSWQAWEDGASYVSVNQGSLIGSDKLAGSGGNMVRFTMNADDRYVRTYRALETPLTSSEVWIMATFRSQHGMDPSATGESKSLAVQLSSVKNDPDHSIYAADNVFAQFGRLANTDLNMHIWDSSGNTSSSYALADWGHGSESSGIYTMVAKYERSGLNAGNLSVKVYYEGGSGTISGGNGELRPGATEPSAFDATQNVGTHDVASILLMASGYHTTVDFDEIRVAQTWAQLLGGTEPKPGDLSAWTAQSDGNEMVRLAFTAPANAHKVIILDKSTSANLTSDEQALQGQAVGATAGNATVVWKGDVTAGDSYNVEFTVPAGSTHYFHACAQNVTKYSDNYTRATATPDPLTMGTYPGSCYAAEAFAYTNGTFLTTSTGSQGWMTGGKGWAGAWEVTGVPSTEWSPGAAVKNATGVEGLLETTQLSGAGGNMLALYPGTVVKDANKAALLKRELTTALSSGGTWWGMFTMKISTSAAHSWAGIQLIDASGNVKASIGKLWGGTTAGIEGSATGTSTYGVTAGQTYVYIFKWDGSKMWLHVQHVASTSNPDFSSYSTPGFTDADDTNVSLSMADIKYIQLVAENGRSGDSGTCVEDTWFDEIRFGPSFSSLVGGSGTRPAVPGTLTATRDGNEMYRLSWEKNGTGSDVILVGTTDGSAPPTALVDNTSYAVGATVAGTTAKVLYKGGATALDHVVAPGTTCKYRLFSDNGDGLYSSTGSYAAPEATGTYESWECLDTFSYTNGVEVASSGNGWKGGQGWGDNYWGSSYTGDKPAENRPKWYARKPGEVPAAMVNDVVNYPASAGNVLSLENMPWDNSKKQEAVLNRVVESFGGSRGNTIYFAYRMAYQYSEAGKNRWAGIEFVSDVGGEKSVFVGKAAATDHQYHLGITATGASSPCWPNVGSGGAAYELKDLNDNANNAYVVVGKIDWTADNTATIYANAFYTGGDGLPENEPGWGSYGYSGATLGAINSIRFKAGADAGHGTVGQAYFDELRWGTSWDQLLAGKAPTDVWMDGQTTHVYTGDIVTNAITSEPKGAKQSAQSLIWTGANPADSTWESHAIAAGFYDNTAGGTKSIWHGVHQITDVPSSTTLTLYGLGAVTGNGTTVKSQNHGEATYKTHTYTVRALTAPTLNVTPGDFKETLSWTRATGYNEAGTSGGRTFNEVMVVRYSSSDASGLAGLKPVDGTAYYPGDVIHYNNDPAESRYMTVVYRGSDATGHVDAGLAKNTTYYYAAFTVNNTYYSPKSTVQHGQTTGTSTTPTVDGLTTDWVGGASPTPNSAAYSEEEFIWTDKALEGRHNTDECKSADIKEFRVKATASTVYFLLRLAGETPANVNPTNVYVSVGVDTRTNSASEKMNWLGDEAATFVGGGYYGGDAAIHYPERQLAVHYVGGSENTWQVEMYKENGEEWNAPGTDWAVACSPDASGDPCIEWSVPREELGLTGTVTGRFTVATFVNSQSWNNQGAGTVRFDNGTCAAVDAMEFVPYGVNDQDGNLGAWDEGLKDGNVNFWADVRFTAAGLAVHSAPTVPSPVTGAGGPGSPLLQWSASSDTDGFVTGYLLEVATNAAFGAAGDLLLYRVNVEGAATTSFQTRTSVSNFYWRVRARDSAGILSAGTAQAYTVTGKTDRDGPLAKLLYVGTNVMAFLNNTDGYRDDQEKSGDATSVEDSDLQDGGHTFGFVIEWYDVNGVYATNVNRNTGEFAWNILAEHEDGQTPYGRVSPNWDLIIIDRKTPAGTKPPDQDVDGKHLAYTWKEGLELPTENGGTETINCWYIDCGKDAVFQLAEIINDGNFGQYMTNYVVGAFQFANYREGVELYLTVSAEDGCMDTGDAGTSGEAGWWAWPSWYNGSSGSYGDGPQTDVNCSGYCKDGPHRGRNVTTNQLLKFYVRDNDVQPPVASTNLWGADATDAAGAKFTPSLVVATSAVTKAQAVAWGSIPGKLASISGAGRDTTYQLTDEVIGKNLTFLFNVCDEYLHSGLQLGTAKRATVGGHTLTNTAFLFRNWNPATGEWGDSTENTAQYASGISTLYDINPTTGEEAVGTHGTGPKTVLAWNFGEIAENNIDSLFGLPTVTSILSYIGTNSAGSTNLVQLHLWDSDNNREGDQADEILTFGKLILTDDDATAPVSPGYSLLGTGTNYVDFGALAEWDWSGTTKPSWTTKTRLKGIDATEMSAWSVGSSGDTAITGDSVKWTERASSVPEGQDWSAMSRRYMSLEGGMQGATYQAAGGAKYFQFDVCGENGARWTADTLQFDNRVTAKGPTLYTLTVQEAANVTTLDAVTADGQKDPAWNVSGGVFEKANGILRFTLESTGGTASLASPSFQPNSNGRAMTRVQYRVGRIGGFKDGATLTVGYRIGSGTRTVVKTHASTDFAESAANKFANYEVVSFDLPTDQAGNFTVTWEASGINGSQGFLLTDVSVVMQNSFNTEHPLVQDLLVEKAVDSSTDGSQETIKNVVMSWDGTENAEGTTWRYRLYAYGADGTGNWGINKIKLLGITMSPRGMDVTDHDLRHATWANSLEVVDGEKEGWDTVKSGLWLNGDKAPSYVLSYPEADVAGRAGTAVASGTFTYKDGKIRKAAYSVLPDGTFEADPTAWTLSGATIEAGSGTRAKVLKLAGADSAASSAKRGFDVSLGSIDAADVSGVTVSGGFEAKASVAAGSGGVNGLAVTVRLKDAGGNVLLAKTFAYEPVAAWRQLEIGPWTVDNPLVRKAEAEIAQTTAAGTELLVANVALQLATWGAPTGEFANGEPGAKLELQTTPVEANKTLKLSSELTREGSKEYVLASTVHDYDQDRTDDARALTIATGFELYDDDSQPPALGAKFGGPVGIRLGNRAGSPYNGSGTNVEVVVTDQQMEAAMRAGGTESYLDIDGYDQSGWTTTALALDYTGGSIANLVRDTSAEGTPGLPSATNTFSYSLATLWANAFVQNQFASHTANMTVNATLTDWDDDRDDDSLATTSQLGYVKFMDNDTTAPAMRTSGSLKGMFIATNPPGESIETALTGVSNASWAAKSQYEVRVLTASDTASERTQLIYDGELRRQEPFYLMANVGDALQSGTGVSISGLQRGNVVSSDIQNGFGDTVTVSNTTMVLTNSSMTIGTNLATHFSETYSSAFKTTRGGTAAAPQTWYWPSGMNREEVSFLLPSGQSSLDFAVFVDAFDCDTNRPGDQAHAQLAGPTLRVRDDDTTAPTQPGSVQVNGSAVNPPSGGYNRYNAPWTNSLSGFSLSFDASADNVGNSDPYASGIAGYWLAPEGAAIATNGAKKISSSEAETGTIEISSWTGIEIAQGLQTWQLFSCDKDDDRDGDSLVSDAVGVPIALDETLPTSVTSLTASNEAGDLDPTSMMRLTWDVPGTTGMGPDNLPEELNTSDKMREGKYSPWDSYKVYYTTYEPLHDLPSVENQEVQDAIDNPATVWTAVTASNTATTYATLTNPATTTFDLQDLEPGENYIFAIVGRDRAGNESATKKYAVGDTIKFIVTQGVMRAWGTVSDELNKAALGGTQMFVPSNNANLRSTPALYWDARINATTERATRGYSLVYRDDTIFREGRKGAPLSTPGGHAGWGDKAGNSISNNFYAEPDGNAQRLGRGNMRFYRATYAGREYAEGGVMPLASEEVYALHNVKLSEGRNFVALHGVPYTNTFAGVFGTDTTYWPAGTTMGNATRVEFFDGGLTFATTTTVSECYWLNSNGKWYDSSSTDVTTNLQTADFFTRGFAITLPPRASGYYDSSEVRIVETGPDGFQTNYYKPVFNWSPILQMPTNDAAHKFSVRVKCGESSVVPFGLTNFTKRTAVDTLVSFRAPVSVHPSQLGLPLVSSTSGNLGFTYNTAHPELGDRLLIMAAASKDARIRFDESECGNATHSLGSLSQMYYDGATEKWRWFDKGNSSDPEVTGWPIKPNDALVIRSCNGGTHTNWTWSYTPTNLYDAADRHFGY